MDKVNIDFAIACFKQYIVTIEDLNRGNQPLGHVSITTADIDHSALLYRLLEGKPKLDKAPPKCYSYPCYDLGEGKPVRIIEIHGPYDDSEFGLVIEQSRAWKWVDKEKGILQHQNGDFFKLTQVHDNIGGGGILQKCNPL